MPRIDDLIDLAQSAHELYLISPARNLRSVYIQIDNLCELAMKTWLQLDSEARQKQCFDALSAQNFSIIGGQRGALLRFFRHEGDINDIFQAYGEQPGSTNAQLIQQIIDNHNQPAPYKPVQNWEAEYAPDRFKSFHDVSDEVLARHPAASVVPNSLTALLSKIKTRRDNRNRFFHNHNDAGIAPTDKDCLEAILDFHSLCAALFGTNYSDAVRANSPVAAQLAVLRLKRKGDEAALAAENYDTVLRKYSPLKLLYGRLGFEFCAMYQDSSDFHERIQNQFQAGVTEIETEILRIEGLTKLTRQNRERLDLLRRQKARLESIMAECFR